MDGVILLLAEIFGLCCGLFPFVKWLVRSGNVAKRAKNFKYIFAVFAGCALYGTMSSFVKIANADGFGIAQIAFFQALFAAAMRWGFACIFGDLKNAKMSIRETLETLLAGCAVGMVNLFYYRSLEYTFRRCWLWSF